MASGRVRVPFTAVASPAGEIIAEASEQEADLIVMGSHGRDGFQRLLMGSVTERVVRHSTTPVLVIPNTEA